VILLLAVITGILALRNHTQKSSKARDVSTAPHTSSDTPPSA
jgi:hypothetical protein